MPTLVPVDGDPFADQQPVSLGAGSSGGAVTGYAPLTVTPGQRGGQVTQPTLVPVLGDPFADEAPSSPAPQTGDNAAAVGQGIINGVPIVGPYLSGGVTNLAAEIRSLQHGTNFDDEKKKVQAFNALTQQANPKSEVLGNVIGATAGTLPLAAAAPVAFGAGEGPVFGRATLGALTGAGIGGTDAGVRTNGDPRAMAMAAALGGAGGAAGPIAANLIGRGAASATDVWNTGENPIQGLSSPAARALIRPLANDGALNSGQGAANIAAAGPNGMLADAGPNAQAVLDLALQRGGPDVQAARQAVEERAATSADALNSHLDNALGQPQGAFSAEQALRSGTATTREQAYANAYSQPIDYQSPAGQKLDSLLDRIPNESIAASNKLMKVEGNEAHQTLTFPSDDPNAPGAVSHYPNVRQLDYITRHLNDVSARGDGAGVMGGNTQAGRAYGNLSSDIRSALREAVPEYGDALDEAKDVITKREALQFGQEMLGPKMDRDEVFSRIQSMGPGELDYARQGLRSAIDEHLANVKAVATDHNIDARQGLEAFKKLSTPANQEKMSALIDPAYHADLAGALGDVGRDQALRASVSRNSATGARAMTKESIDSALEPGVVGAALQGKPVKTAQAIVQAITQSRPSDLAARSDSQYGEILRALTGPRGPDAQALLEQFAAQNAARESGARGLGSAAPGFRALAQALVSGGGYAAPQALQTGRTKIPR